MTAWEVQDDGSTVPFRAEDAARGLERWQTERARAVGRFLSGPLGAARDEALAQLLRRLGGHEAFDPEGTVEDAIDAVVAAAEEMAERAYLLGLGDREIRRVQDLVPVDLWPTIEVEAQNAADAD